MKTRRQLKKVAAFLLAACIIISMIIALAPTVKAAEIHTVPASGQMGDNVLWTVNAEGNMTIRGTGATWDLKDPWAIGNGEFSSDQTVGK